MKQIVKIALLTGLFVIMVLPSAVFSSDSSDREKAKSWTTTTRQIWGVQIEADPGESAKLEQDFEAAHGPYDGDVDKDSVDDLDKDSFGIIEDDDGKEKIVKGEDYVGSYFHIEQLAYTTGGVLKRYIDMSSPWSHGYLHEDMSVIGSATVEESFSMDNLAPGTSGTVTWHDLF